MDHVAAVHIAQGLQHLHQLSSELDHCTGLHLGDDDATLVFGQSEPALGDGVEEVGPGLQ